MNNATTNRKEPRNRVGSRELVRHPGLYRAKLSCRIGRDAIEGKTRPPEGCTSTEYALFNMLHAIEEIADALLPNVRDEPRHEKGHDQTKTRP